MVQNMGYKKPGAKNRVQKTGCKKPGLDFLLLFKERRGQAALLQIGL